jgi:hypothetical protein
MKSKTWMRYSTKQKDAYRTRRNIEYGSKEIRFPIILSVTSIYFIYFFLISKRGFIKKRKAQSSTQGVYKKGN